MRNDPMQSPGVWRVWASLLQRITPNMICPRTRGKALLSKQKMAFPQLGTIHAPRIRSDRDFLRCTRRKDRLKIIQNGRYRKLA